jgi:methylmalonyl-CoA/ethylmalonyl-CoA epimerase
MKLGRLNHIGVATPDLDASITFYRDVMGATDITEPFVLESQQVRVCFVNTPGVTGGAEGGTAGTQIELLQPTTADSAVGKRVLGEPRIGAHGTLIFFVHPKDMGGQLTEIMEVPKGAH